MQAQRTQRAVLGLVLYEHPDSVTVGDLRREIGEGADQAVAHLTEVGLLSRDGEAVRPTPAAVAYDALRLP